MVLGSGGLESRGWGREVGVGGVESRGLGSRGWGWGLVVGLKLP